MRDSYNADMSCSEWLLMVCIRVSINCRKDSSSTTAHIVGELDYVSTNWNEAVIERTCQGICSAGTTQ